jgi:hypothetical protein
MWIATVFEEENSLPRAELHFAVDNRNRLARPRQRRANVRGHIVRSFLVMFEVLVLRHEFVEEPLQIATRSRRGILHRDQAAAGVLDKNRRDSRSNSAFIDDRLNLFGDFVRPLSLRLDFKFVRMHAHKNGQIELHRDSE